MAFLRLLPIARYEYYGDDGCFFNLSGRNYHIENEYANIFNSLLNNRVEYIEDNVDEKFKELVNKLLDEGVLYLYDTSVYNTKLFFNNEKSIPGIIENPPRLKKLYIEASRECGVNCKLCGWDSLTRPCRVCAIWENEENVCDQSILTDCLNRILNIPVEEVVILGGNPFTNWGYIEKTILAIRNNNKKTKITLVSNALCIDINKIDFMRGNKVCLDITLTDVKKNINRIKESILNVDNTKIKYKLVLIEKTELVLCQDLVQNKMRGSAS